MSDTIWPLSVSRIHFERLKNIPVLQLDASVEFLMDPEVREQFVTKVCPSDSVAC